MEAIGELVEPITTNLYAWRVPVAIVSIIAAFVVAAIAIRRGWFAAARRHPARATALIVVGFVVVAPMAWYLGSPVFLRSSLVEAAPTAAPSAGVVAIDPTAPATPLTSEPAPSAAITSEPTAPPTPVPTPFEPVAVATGEFTGTDDFHFGRGTATVIEVGPGRYHLRLEDFSVRNGPDLFVYLSPDADGYHEDALELGRLKATDGSFGYDLPDGVDPAVFRSAIIWCKQFAHLFATAPFDPV